MLKLYDNGIYLVNGETICSCPEEVAQKDRPHRGRKGS